MCPVGSIRPLPETASIPWIKVLCIALMPRASSELQPFPATTAIFQRDNLMSTKIPEISALPSQGGGDLVRSHTFLFRIKGNYTHITTHTPTSPHDDPITTLDHLTSTDRSPLHTHPSSTLNHQRRVTFDPTVTGHQLQSPRRRCPRLAPSSIYHRSHHVSSASSNSVPRKSLSISVQRPCLIPPSIPSFLYKRFTHYE